MTGEGPRLVVVAALLAAAAACGQARSRAAGEIGCTACHGDPARAASATTDPLVAAAPPRSLSGGTDPATRGVGAHLRHLTAGAAGRAVPCSSCHLLPAAGFSHPLQDQGRVTFSGLSVSVWLTGTSVPQPAWNGTSCAGTYCHGSFPGGAPANAPVWTAPRADACGTCHGLPPPSPHPQSSACGACHPGYTATSVDPVKHLDGQLESGIGPGTACGDCHAIPPDTGAHRAHYGDLSSPPLASYGDTRILADYRPGGGPAYMFGCGLCHPLDPSRHLDGLVQVELYSPLPSGGLKARASPQAAYAGGRCDGVYCHSSGQTIPAYATTPAWTSGLHLGCGDCHGNPPRYPSGGAGTDTANSHLVLADDGWELGHYAGVPGPWHEEGHGNWSPPLNAAPVTCQTCHFLTADPASTGPSGVYWLGTDGNYRLDLPGANPARLGQPSWQNTQCATCHQPVQGRVLPLHHVNGVRDVAFDPRPSVALSGYPGAPADPATPPVWSILSSGGAFTADLRGAGYDPATRTCSNVGCHLLQTRVRWGLTPVGMTSCDYCHQQSGVPPPP